MLDLHQLNIFVTAAETLSFTETAQRLNLSQPAVSQHIKALERHFNVTLFQRTGKGLRLSDEGSVLLPLAKEMVYQSVRVEEMMASLHGDIFGNLLVGCSTTPGKYVLPQILAALNRRHPRVKVTCHVASQRQALDMLCSGEIHFALSSLVNCSHPNAEFRLFMRDPVVLIAPEDHPWAGRKAIQPEELLTERYIMREPESGTYEVLSRALHGVGIEMEALNSIMMLGNSEAIALAVQEGLGLGFVSYMIATRITHRGVKIIPVDGLKICRAIYIGRQTVHPPTAAQIAFWDLVQQLNPVNVCGEPDTSQLNLPADM